MPATTTPRVLERAEKIINELRSRGCASISELCNLYGLTHTQVYYVARMLCGGGQCERHRIGKVLVICTPGSTPDVVTVARRRVDPQRIKKFICKLAHDTRGKTLTISTALLAKKLYGKEALNQPVLMATLRAVYRDNVYKTIEDCLVTRRAERHVFNRRCVLDKCRSP